MDSQEGTAKWRAIGDSIAYCSTGVLATVDSYGGDGTIEVCRHYTERSLIDYY